MSFMGKWLRRVVATATLVAIAAAGPAARAGDQDFTLVNHTGVEIHKL